MPGWDQVGARRGDSDGLASSKDQDTSVHLHCRGKQARAFKKQRLRADQVWLHPDVLEMESGGAAEAGIAALWVLADPHLAAYPPQRNSAPGMHLLLRITPKDLSSLPNSRRK